MEKKNFPQIGDLVFVRDEYAACGYQSGILTKIEDGIERFGADGAYREEGHTYTIEVGEDGHFIETAPPGEEGQLFYESEEAILEQIEAECASVRVITASEYFDRTMLPSLERGVIWSDPVDRLRETERGLLGLLRRQYGIMEPEEMYKTHGEEVCIDFLNEAVRFYERGKKNSASGRASINLSTETVKEFLSLAAEEEIHCEHDEPLTIRRFLKMCRVAYEGALIPTEYPPNASDLFLYCGERMLSYAEDFREYIDADWDSPEVFETFKLYRYHTEELQFGGMYLNLYDVPGGWAGKLGCPSYNPRHARQTILAYIAMRRGGYPIFCHRPQEILERARLDIELK